MFRIKKIEAQQDLLVIGVLTLILILVVTGFPSTWLRVALGLPFVLFFPGYALIVALFPRKSDLDGITRVALSFGLSIAVVPLIGLILNYTPWGVRLYPILISLALFIFGMSAIAWYRRWRLPPEERFRVSFHTPLPSWGGQGSMDRALSIILVVAILGAMGTLGYVIATPKVEERFTEFYILGLEGKAELYPSEFVMEEGEVVLVRYDEIGIRELEEERGRVVLGIKNHEHERASYEIEANIDGQRIRIWLGGEERDKVEITLDDGEEWEQEIEFAPQQISGDQKLEFVLYKDGKPYFEEPVHLWIKVESL